MSTTPDGAIFVGGLVPFTTIDFPGRLAAVVFCQGCPWRCGYCHNPHLQANSTALPAGADAYARAGWAGVLRWLQSRAGLLEAVVFSGGEPLLQRDLPAALRAVRALGFATALHTAGIYPERLAAALPWLDWVGFDVKGPFEDYARITGGGSGASARRALALLLQSGVAHQIRCTVDPDLLDAPALARMHAQLADFGVHDVVLQHCRKP